MCSGKDTVYALVIPDANTEAVQHHDGIAQVVETGRHAVVVTDRADWHMSKQLKCSANLSLLPLPVYSPDLNSVEQVWQQLRDKHWANRCFKKDYDDIVTSCCEAWNSFIGQPDVVQRLSSRQWTVLT